MPSKLKKVFSSPLIIVEILIASLIVIVALAVLNYFNIVSLSNTLSFLPQQRGKDQSNLPSQTKTDNLSLLDNKKLTSKAIITPDNPQKFSNNAQENTFGVISNSLIKVTGPLLIDVELLYDSQAASKENSSGLIFYNQLAYSNENYSALKLFRYSANKAWALEFRSKGQSIFFELGKTAELKSFQKFQIAISQDGKSLRVIAPNLGDKTFQLPNSLYETSNQMIIMATVAPKTELTVYSLYYQH